MEEMKLANPGLLAVAFCLSKVFVLWICLFVLESSVFFVAPVDFLVKNCCFEEEPWFRSLLLE
jgi:hypothetical protein